MSQVLIDTYRGWEIYFDTDGETFYCHSEKYDRDNVKKTFSSTKKFIDDFIKDNQNFKPFVIQPLPGCYEKDFLTVFGIRKDGVLMVETPKGLKKQLSIYDEKKYILRNPDTDVFIKEAEKISAQINDLSTTMHNILKNVVGVSLVDFKETLI